MELRMSRRAVLGGVGGMLAGSSLAGCSLLSTDPANNGKAPGSGQGPAGKEAPSLAKLVESGDLPPLEERLPSNPMVIQPVDRVGTYGGTWQTALKDAGDKSWLKRTMGFENLVGWTAGTDWAGRPKDVVPNLAESWEQDPAAKEFVFTLRSGIKWSDGEPFTAKDVEFAVNDVLNNPDVFPNPQLPGKAEAVDDATLRITLDEPNSQFVQFQATSEGVDIVSLPMHYMKQFHKKYNPDADKLAKEQKQDSWGTLLLSKMEAWSNLDLPVLSPWVYKTAIGDGSTMDAERNPYYWKTDPDGRQLPYLDGIRYQVIPDLQVLTLKATDGELDFHTRHINTLQNKPVLAGAREKANFKFMDLVSSAPSNAMLIMLNHTHKDPVKRKIFRNKEFRIGLSHAIDRKEIITATLQGQGTPAQHGPRPESPFHNEQLLTQYVEYDVAEANSRLDKAGYSKKDGDGWRLGPDDKPIRFAIDTTQIFGQPWVEMLELVRKYWAEVGIDVSVSNMERTLLNTRGAANQQDAVVWEGQGGLDVLIRQGDFVPINPTQGRYARLWADWYASGGKKGEKPPEQTRKQMELHDQLLATTDAAEQEDLLKQILQIAADEFYTLGISLVPSSYGIVKNNFHNVPDTLVESFLHNTPGAANPCQFFKSEPDE